MARTGDYRTLGAEVAGHMVTYVYICKDCGSPEAQYTFEVTYVNLGEAEGAPLPACPQCGGVAGVSRYYGHAIYGPRKSALSDHRTGGMDRYVPLRQGQEAGVLSVGMRLSPELMSEIKTKIKKMADDAGVDISERAQNMIPDKADGARDIEGTPLLEPVRSAAKDKDLISDVLGLRPGTVDRTLFDLRQKKLIDDLKSGIPFSGFFMPLTGSTSN